MGYSPEAAAMIAGTATHSSTAPLSACAA
ncbi:uncharacterized protein METZ01_LOCUS177394, partial [marine metagenome]